MDNQLLTGVVLIAAGLALKIRRPHRETPLHPVTTEVAGM